MENIRNLSKLPKNSKGITLIALVITIIVLLILAGISIATLTGQNGLLTKADTAKEESKKAEYKEVLELIGNGLRPEKIMENLTTKDFMDRYQEEIEKKIKEKGTLEGATIERKSDEKIWVITKEEYIYEITEEKVILLGKKGENPLPTLKQTDLTFKLTPSGYTNQNIMVEIIPKINMDGFTLQYSTDGTNWTNYTQKYHLKKMDYFMLD